MAPKITSSSNRSKRLSTKPVTKGQYPQRQNRQSVSQANVTKSGDPRPAGAPPAKVTSSADRPKTSGLSILSNVMNVMGALRRFGPAAAAYEVSKPRPTAAGTLSAARQRGDYKPSQNIPNPQEGMTRAESFDQAFATARQAGEKSFTWRGRTYNTKMKGE